LPAKIEYKASVARDLPRLGPASSRRILDQLEKALSKEGHAGRPLTGEFTGLYRLRVWDYRVIFARTAEGCLLLRVGHRREVSDRGRPEV